ncbi:MAG: hypothetical protein QM698_02800 [Micropepsaceae bacterium]
MSKASRSKPVRGRIDADGGRHGLHLAGLQLDAKPSVPAHREQVIDDVEAPGAFGIVGAADVDQRGEAQHGMIAQRGERRDDLGGLDGERDFAIGRRQHSARNGGGDFGAQRRQGFGGHRAHRSIVPTRRIFFCSCRMP